MTTSNKLAVFAWCLFMAVLYLATNAGLFASQELSEDSTISDCQKLSFSRVGKSGKKYTYRVAAACVVSKEAVKGASAIVSDYLDDLHDNSHVSVLRHDENVQFEGLEGHRLEIVETFDSGHGNMKITGDLFVVSNNSDQFIYNFRSKKIDADGEAKSTKQVKAEVTVQSQDDKVQLGMEKLVVVEKAWWWPEGVFEREVKSGILEEMKDLVEMHRGLILK